MAPRAFKLPGIQDLTKEQERARALPKEGQHLIVGGPGTGKSILALIRARRLARDEDRYLFLVFNHLLHRASQQLFAGEHALDSATWHRWFRQQFRDITGQPIPLLPAQGADNFRPIDWQGVQSIVHDRDASRLPAHLERLHLVIDEGQDMPPAFYQSLIELGFENFFVACDQNQQIMDDNSSRQDIRDNLALEEREVIELVHNHRNSYPIARLAREFYTGDPASPPPELPPLGRAEVPLLYVYPAPARLERVTRSIVRLADREPNKLIGVLAPNNQVRQNYFDGLETSAEKMRLDHGLPAIATFYGAHRPDVHFDKGGILVINAQACKGLEFDVVMLADIDQYRVKPTDPDALKKLFYVMIARAREKIFLFMRQDANRAVEQLLPTDPAILRREAI